MTTVTFLTNEDMEQIGSRISDLEYLHDPLQITSFRNNVGTVEIGRTITSVTFTWTLSKTVKTITFDGSSLPPDARQTTLSNLSIKASKPNQSFNWTLKVTDARDTAVTASTSISFLNGIYYGVAEQVDVFDDAFVLSLTKELRSSNKTINVTAGPAKYIYYCVPTRFGECSFKVGIAPGGFEKVSTINFTNSSKYTESYNIYRSVNANLGACTVEVTKKEE